MSAGPWGKPFVGAFVFIDDPGVNKGVPFEEIPCVWADIRFDAVDVLFISPFRILTDDLTFSIEYANGVFLTNRLQWIIGAARTANPDIKIIVNQFYGDQPGVSDFSVLTNDDQIQTYVDSVVQFIGNSWNQTVPAVPGPGTVSARVDGYDVDVEQGNMNSPNLAQILKAVRIGLDELGNSLGTTFTLSICPAWTTNLDSDVGAVIDYVNMQNYDGGFGTSPEDYLQAMPNLQASQLNWGISSESPEKNTTSSWDLFAQKVQDMPNAPYSGIWSWRLNSDNLVFENQIQIYMYNSVKGANLTPVTPASTLSQEWPTGGRSSQNFSRAH